MSGSTYTPNFRLQKPPFDVVPWDQAVNGNMDIIDAALAKYLTIPNFVGSWKNTTGYSPPQTVNDSVDGSLWQCVQGHTSASPPTTFAQDRASRPNLWTLGAATTLNPGVVVSDTPPAATQGTLWWSSADGQMYVRYDDGSSQQWVTATNIGGFPNVATKDDVAAVQNNVGRNLLHNPMFGIGQRGAGPFTTFVYTMDRWAMFGATDIFSVTQSALADAGRAVIGDEQAVLSLSNNFVGNAGAGAFHGVQQKIENIQRLSNKTITVSFWAAAFSGTPRLGVSIDQFFGTGGSPSATIQGVGQSVTLSTAWARYSLTFTVGSSAGKTFGTNNDHFTALNIWFSSGANNAARSGSIGVQTAIINIWGVQLEVGSVMTPLEKPDPRHDLANCQRFYRTGLILWGGYVTATCPYYASTSIAGMRALPTISSLIDTSTTFGTRTLAASGEAAYVTASATATGGGTLNVSFSASADL